MNRHGDETHPMEQSIYRTILWPTDASAQAEDALREALRVLSPGGRLIAFHCKEHLSGSRDGGSEPLLPDEGDRVVALRAEVAQLQDEGVDVVFRVMSPRRSPVEEIVRAAEIYDVDLIVCGTRGFGAAAQGGTIAKRLPNLAPCPVLLVSERAAERSRHLGRAEHHSP
jgi:nucleotide-binding universal stress UspA family protein